MKLVLFYSKLYDLSNQHFTELTNLFNQEELTIPDGFTDNDVNINAPRLFADSFYLGLFIFHGKNANASLHSNFKSNSTF